jgi:hypothetical protein
MVASWKTRNLRISHASWSFILGTFGGLLLPAHELHAAGASVRAVVGTVVVIRDGTNNQLPVAAGDELHDADRLQGVSPGASTQLECHSGATQTLTGRFDAVLNPSIRQGDCAIDLNAGAAIATTPHSTVGRQGDPHSASIKSGPIAMTSHHTQFGFEVVLSKKLGMPQAEGFVLDGSAACHDVDTGKQWTIQSGKKINTRSKAIMPVDDAKYVRLATAFARLDLSQNGALAADPASEKALQTRWLAVLKRPQDATARVNLIETQVSLKVSASSAFAYQASRADVLVQNAADPALKTRWQNLRARLGADFVRPTTNIQKQP